MSLDVSELMADPDFMRSAVLRRPTIHFANEGEAIASYTDTDVLASVQPATAVEIASLPEGTRGSGRVVKIYSATEFKQTNGADDTNDVLVTSGADGGSFKVVGVEPWGAHGYWKSLAVEFIP